MKLGLVDIVLNEWNDNKKAINFKIALGRGEAKWCDRHKYGFPYKDLDNEPIIDGMINNMIWLVYTLTHPLKVAQAHYYSLKEMFNPTEIF